METTNGISFEPNVISNGFGQYFYSAVQLIRSRLLENLRNLANQVQEQSAYIFSLSQISEEFVQKELLKIKANKPTGLINRRACLIKDGVQAISKLLTVLLNRSVNEGSIPSDWKHATVTPIHKTGSKANPANFRPISVLPVFSKVLERAVHIMVSEFLQENNILSIYQSGFRRHHSTSTSLTDITKTVLHNMEKGQLTGMAFLDLAKAFDTLDHETLYKKLARLRFSRSALLWFKAYLTNRSQTVIVNGVPSDSQPVLYGVPQGSTLAPLLFIIYINDLYTITDYCNERLYADDTLFYFSSNLVSEIETCLNHDLNRIITWLNSNYLFLNFDKTKVMLLGTSNV